MNAFNRIFSVIALIAILVVGVLVLVFPGVLIGLIQSLDTTIKSLSGNANGSAMFAEAAVRILFTLLFVGLMVALLWLELRRSGIRSVQVMRHNGKGRLRVTAKAVEDRIHQRIDALPGVINSTVVIKAQNRALAVKLDVLAAHDTDLVLKGEEIVGAVRNVVQDDLGLKLFARPEVTMKAAPPPRSFLPNINSILNRRKEEPIPAQLSSPTRSRTIANADADDIIDVDAGVDADVDAGVGANPAPAAAPPDPSPTATATSES
jgi:hypothetical protein